MEWDYENYFEPGEFDEKIEELKEELKKSVKKEINDEIEKLRKENKELQDVKKNFESIKSDFDKKKREYDIAIKNAECTAKDAKLKELMERFKINLWSANWTYMYKKKCDKCDKYRQIQVTLPSGRIVDDNCSCGQISKKVYYPQENILYELRNDENKVMAWYIEKGKKGKEYFVLEDFYPECVKLIIDHNKDFKAIDRNEISETFFSTKEECQAFCDYLNKDNEVVGYNYNVQGELIINDGVKDDEI